MVAKSESVNDKKSYIAKVIGFALKKFLKREEVYNREVKILENRLDEIKKDEQIKKIKSL